MNTEISNKQFIRSNQRVDPVDQLSECLAKDLPKLKFIEEKLEKIC
jgi:hypothetical protein